MKVLSIIGLAATANANKTQMAKDLERLFDSVANFTSFDRTLNPGDMGMMQNYGCWCSFDYPEGTEKVHGRGAPVDEVDKYCKTLQNGYECAMMDHYDDDLEVSTCTPWEVEYLSTFETNLKNPGAITLEKLKDTCDDNNVDSCARAACKVEGWLVQSYFAFAVTGGRFDIKYQEEGGFDRDTGCPINPSSGSPERACCGNHPLRFPFRVGGDSDRDCCNGKTFSPSLYSCCPDGRARIDCL